MGCREITAINRCERTEATLSCVPPPSQVSRGSAKTYRFFARFVLRRNNCHFDKVFWKVKLLFSSAPHWRLECRLVGKRQKKYPANLVAGSSKEGLRGKKTKRQAWSLQRQNQKNAICISNGTFLLTVTVYCYIIQLSSMYYGGPL